MHREERLQAFVRAIWRWYALHKRLLPWRDMEVSDDNERAYRVLVSEIMLQQTQVARVEGAFRRFLTRFPTLRALAEAGNRDVLIAWRGMGYNSRALRLRDAAREVLIHHGGRFPRAREELLQIPGIGPYTAAAVLNFAFAQPEPCLDTNIRRILHRTFYGFEKPDGTWAKGDRLLLKLADDVLREAMHQAKTMPRAAAEWHAALMDFGSLVQTKRSPKWHVCPLTKEGIMVASPRGHRVRPRGEVPRRAEPGRMIAGRFIPNRIIRGRIVEELREYRCGLPLPRIGREVCIDWKEEIHVPWLQDLLNALVRDGILECTRERYALAA